MKFSIAQRLALEAPSGHWRVKARIEGTVGETTRDYLGWQLAPFSPSEVRRALTSISMGAVIRAPLPHHRTGGSASGGSAG